MRREGRRAAAVAAALGALFGMTATLLNAPPGGDVLDDSLRRTASLVVGSGAAWGAAAVLGGWLAGSPSRGLVAGPVVLLLAVLSYYLAGAMAGSENADGSADQVAYFALAALLTGPVLGAVGSGIRRRDAVGLAAALVVPLGVCAELAWRASGGPLPPDPSRPLADAVLVTLATVGAAVAVARYVAGRRSRRRETAVEAAA